MRSMSPDGAEAEGAPGDEHEPCPDCGGACLGPEPALTEADCMWLGNRLDRMDAARPAGAALPCQLRGEGYDTDAVEWVQLLAFEAQVERWWEVLPEGRRISTFSEV